MILIFDILLQDCYWSICHVSWVIRFESGLRNIDFSQRYQVEKLAQYRWDIRYVVHSGTWPLADHMVPWGNIKFAGPSRDG